MKKRLMALSLAALMVVSLSACGTKTETPAGDKAEAKEIYIGGLAPLTGDVAVYGKASSDGSKLAIEEVNAVGGVLGKLIKFDCLDEKGDPTEAVTAYNRLSSQGIVALIGDVTSKPTIGVSQIAAEEGMPMVTPTATAMAVTDAGKNIFRVCFTDPYQGETMATFAASNLTAKTYAVIYNNSDDYSSGLAEAFIAKANSLGMTMTANEAYGKDAVDFKAQLTKIAEGTPEVLFIPDYYNNVVKIASQAREVGLDSTFLGADGWDGVLTVSADLSAIEGAFFCNHYSTEDADPTVQAFLTNYNKKYGEVPNSFAALGYDAAKILLAAIEKAGSTDKAKIVEALKNTSYDGVTGHITFDEKGNPVKSVAIITIKGGKYALDSKVSAK